ncbi:type VI secretion system lipoprotein TssJ [Caballeronia sp. EK]|uniref:type VI secretion system lipoprotein TssJ n=1 Tax=Caballeronia sp. EK TaxID=2767469 RepID=UPI001655650A|nr:type VI secretion system lipoprotein TssJ [Caballeronia sp. EK]MBC8642537.1 type VI secretion system lipoprotein TssJ [Caballeronia sp. EK]
MQNRLDASRNFTGCARVRLATAVAIATLTLAGCGAWQATKDSTVGAAQWLFTTQVKSMNVDLDARAALNETTSGRPLSTVVRFYQLKDSKTFAQLEYIQLQNNDLELLKTDLVATKDVVMRPGASASLREPMEKDAEYVGVVAFFRTPDSDGVWKLLIPKQQWKDTDPVKIQVQGNRLAYQGANPKPITRDTPQQSVPALAASAASAASSVSDASATGKAALQNLNTAADAVKSAKASASAVPRSVSGLLSN